MVTCRGLKQAQPAHFATPPLVVLLLRFILEGLDAK
jgi:hypothetical protein